MHWYWFSLLWELNMPQIVPHVYFLRVLFFLPIWPRTQFVRVNSVRLIEAVPKNLRRSAAKAIRYLNVAWKSILDIVMWALLYVLQPAITECLQSSTYWSPFLIHRWKVFIFDSFLAHHVSACGVLLGRFLLIRDLWPHFLIVLQNKHSFVRELWCFWDSLRVRM